MDPNPADPTRPMFRYYTIGTGRKRKVYSEPIIESFNRAHKRETL